MTRTAIIYTNTRDTYIVVFRAADRDTVTREYTDMQELQSDVIEHIALDFPCLCHGKEYNGDLTGLVMAITSDGDGINIRYNPAAEDDVIKEVFRDVKLSDFLRLRKGA